MKYKVEDCFPSPGSMQKLLDYMSERGWSLKSTHTGISAKQGWLTMVFERNDT